MKNFLIYISLIIFLSFAFVPAKAQLQNSASLHNHSSLSISGSQNTGNDYSTSNKCNFSTFLKHSSFSNFTLGHLIMLLLGMGIIFISIKYDFSPIFLVPIGAGMILGNIPFLAHTGLQIGIYEEGSIFNFFYQGILKGIYPSLLFLAIGAMVDFSSLIANPKLIIIGAATQLAIFGTFLIASSFGFNIAEAASVALTGSADGSTAMYISSKLANGTILPCGLQVQNLITIISIVTFLLMGLVPLIQPAFMRLLVSKKERTIKMKAPRSISKREKILFPFLGLVFTTFLAPAIIPLLGMFFFGNLLKESGVTKRIAVTVTHQMLDIVLILLGLALGASTQATIFLTEETTPIVLKIILIGFVSFILATVIGIITTKIMNLFLDKEDKINPLIGCAGVSAIPDCSKVAHNEGLKADSTNHLYNHAMGANIAGIIGSATTAGILLGFLL